MKTLLTRSLSGIVFAAIMLGGITLHPYSFAILFFIINLGCLWEYYTIVSPLYTINKLSMQTYRAIGLVIGGLIFLTFTAVAFDWVHGKYLWFILPLLYVIPMIELLSLSPSAIRNAALNLFGLVYVSISLSLLMFIAPVSDAVVMEFPWFPRGCATVLGLLLLIWANDTFAYLGGTLAGRNKLYPEISPGKTWEGFLVGALFALLAAYGLYRWFGIYEKQVWIGLALIASIIGTIGDLFESMIKRNVGIKDSGKIMPGHGGFLDRFDAFIFCIPFAWAWLAWVA